MGTSRETAAPPLGEGLTFEKVWASLMELKESQKELREAQKETDRIVRETARQIKETDKQMKETDEWDEWYKKQWDKWIGGPDYFGDIPEHKVHQNLAVKFDEMGFIFTKVCQVNITDREHDIITSVDAWLDNDDTVMAVELRKEPDIDDIQDHLERMKKLRISADLRRDTRKYMGAIAGVVVDENVKNYALKNGFYVLEPSGGTFAITEPGSKGYSLHEW
jgi:hypothetical protein